jgi:hypothetical protein
LYSFEKLPSLPCEIRGDFQWLLGAAEHRAHIGQESVAENAQAIEPLAASMKARGLTLPSAFLRFVTDRALQARVRSNTDCYLDLASFPFPSPTGAGHLIRFLSDSQGCLFWYLYLTPDGSDHAVIASPTYYAPPEEQWQEEECDPAETVFCAESFEAFICRFWIENEVWFAEYEKQPIPVLGQRYLESYRRT